MKKILIPILIAFYFIPCTNTTVYATEIEEANEAVVYSEGLINSHNISISASSKSLLLTANTTCFYSMKIVGIKSIVVQRSTDGSSWKDYSDVSDITTSDTMFFSVSSKNLGTFPGGYYYRVTCKHYAKESGLFGSYESISATSNSVWIS